MNRPPDSLLTLRTSGSAGRPRLVRRTVDSWNASLPALDEVTGLAARPALADPVAATGRARSGELVWAPGPAESTLTLYGLWQGLSAGVPVLASGPWRGVPAGAESATVVHAVPLVAEAIAQAAGVARAQGRPWRLRTAVVSGAGSRPGLRDRLAANGIALVEYYGAAELSFVALDDDGTGLRPFPGVEVELRDGVLWARSPYLALDVDGVPVADATGWASVGDRAAWIGSGRLRLLGRSGTANVAGHTVHLAEVEALLATVPAVAEVVCLAVPDGRHGQRVVAVLRPAGGADPLPAVRDAERALPPAARPVRHRVLLDWPRTAAGKPDRSALQVMAAEAMAAEAMAAATADEPGRPR